MPSPKLQLSGVYRFTLGRANGACGECAGFVGSKLQGPGSRQITKRALYCMHKLLLDRGADIDRGMIDAVVFSRLQVINRRGYFSILNANLHI